MTMTWETIKHSWLGPTGIVTLIGALIWGIQLNVGYSLLKEQVGRIQAQTEVATEVNHRQNEQIARIAAILDSLEQRVTRYEDRHNGD